jgi:hypothetical protein
MVDVVITTWDDGIGKRAHYLEQVLATWRHWGSSRDLSRPLNLIVSDDGSEGSYIEGIAVAYSAEFVTGPHNGIGASLNRSLQHVTASAWVYTTDDWLLTGSMHLARAEALLDVGYDVVRIGPPHPNLTCTIQFQQGIGWWLDLNTDRGGFVFGTRPFLAKRQIISHLGALPEGVDSYEFERWFDERCKHLALRIASATLHGPWEHIGEYEVGDRPIL